MGKVWLCIILGLAALSTTAASYPVVLNNNPVVADDQKLPLRYSALSGVGNEGTINNPVWSVNDPTKAEFQPRQPGDPAVVRGYLVPIGPTGTVRVTLTGTNSRGQEVSGFLDVDIVAGAVTVINIEALAPVDK
jgi:hypothetical protein